MICTRCNGTGFLNTHQLPEEVLVEYLQEYDTEIIYEWMDNNVSDVQVCDCCGDGEAWTYLPGLHYVGEVHDCI
jgi:hypothetical protein